MAHAAAPPVEMAVAEDALIATPRYPNALAAWFGLIVLGTLMVSAVLNNSIVYLMVEPMKRGLSLSDTQIGALNGIALTLMSAIAVVPMGWLADRVDRLRLLAACVVIWSLGTVGFAMAQSFTGLFGFAMGIAVGEAVIGPIIYSLIPDIFPRDKWVQANLVLFVLGRLGGFAGLALAGGLVAFAGSQANTLPWPVGGLEPWRVALILSTLTAPVLVLLTLLIPVRRATVPLVKEGAEFSALLAYFRSNARALAGVFFGFGTIYAVHGGSVVWLPTALSRAYGVEPARIGVALGSSGAIAAALGIAVAFLLARGLRPRHGDMTPMLVAQMASAVIVVTAPLLLLAPTFTTAILVLGVQTFALTVCLSLSPAVLQVLAPSYLRGRVIALGGMISTLIMSVAPMIIGFAADRLLGGANPLLSAIVAATVLSGIIGFALLRFGGGRLPETIERSRLADERAEAAELAA